MISYESEESEDVPPTPSTVALFLWAKSIGIKINPKLQYPVKFFPGYLGTKTVDFLESNEVLITVPNTAMLNSSSFVPAELEQLFIAHPDLFSIPSREHEDYRMLSYILFEYCKGMQSFWYYYLSSLPNDPETVTEWNEKELLELQDSNFVNDLLARKHWNVACCRELTRVFNLHLEVFRNYTVDFHLVYWCWLIMTTRCFGGGLPSPSLIPVADLFNHSNNLTNYYYANEDELAPIGALDEEIAHDDKFIDETDKVKLTHLKICQILGIEDEKICGKAKELDSEKSEKRARIQMEKEKEIQKIGEEKEEVDYRCFRIRVAENEKYQRGSQVKICYGRYSNRMLLTNYGFAVRDNIYNYCRVKLSLHSLFTESQLSSQEDLEGGSFYISYKFTKGKIKLKFLSFLRQILWDSSYVPASCFTASDMKLESKVLTSALEILNGQIEEYETNLQEDKNFLLKPRSTRHTFAVCNS